MSTSTWDRSIWSTVEMECWCRDLPYLQYVEWGGILTPQRYKEIGDLFQKWMEEDFSDPSIQIPEFNDEEAKEYMKEVFGR